MPAVQPYARITEVIIVPIPTVYWSRHNELIKQIPDKRVHPFADFRTRFSI